MIIWPFSDLHLDTVRGWDLPPPSERPAFDVAVCAGDLIPGCARGVRWLAERITDRPVVMVAGNHEFYGRDIDREIEKGRDAAAGTNIHLLHDGYGLVIDDVALFGATFWTDFMLFGTRDASMAIAGARMNDYRTTRVDNYARRLRPRDTLARHRASRAAIEFGLLLHGDCRRRVVVTHHPIHALGGRSRPVIHGEQTDPLDAAYASDCAAMFELGIDAAISGHTHVSLDLSVKRRALGGTTRLISNPKGYGPWERGQRWQNPNFDPSFTFEI